MDINIAICDDDTDFLKSMKSILVPYIWGSRHEIHLDLYSAAGDLISAMRSGKEYRIFFLDVEIADHNGIDLARAHRHELGLGFLEVPLDQRLGILDDADRGDGKEPQVRAHEQRLRIVVADAADPHVTGHLAHLVFELRPEGRVRDVVDLPLKALFRTVDHHAAVAGAKVRVIVNAKKHVQNAVALGHGSEKTAHL